MHVRFSRHPREGEGLEKQDEILCLDSRLRRGNGRVRDDKKNDLAIGLACRVEFGSSGQ